MATLKKLFHISLSNFGPITLARRSHMVKFFLSVKMRIFFYFFFVLTNPMIIKGKRQKKKERARREQESNKRTRVGIHNGLEKKFQ